jgi:hypothetical protein
MPYEHERQEEQRELVERAEEVGGVATAIEVFEAAQGRLPQVVVQTTAFRYATGANRR